MKDALLVDAKIRMHQSLERTQHEFNTIRTGRASVSLLDNIYIDYYGSKTLLKHMSNVSIPEPRAILISPYEPKFLKEIETQISKSDLGINPSNNGKVIRLNVPPLNEERRKELVKLVRKIAEDGKVAIRNIRREINDEFKKLESGSKITEDDLINYQKEVQEITDEFIEKLNDSLAQKEKEIMEV
ncbi:MAG: ribosome recycling factor [Candidatus Hydromicrobium sp.]|nr:ribosome recycling factor [Candidatus Hydromicrobium sp.]